MENKQKLRELKLEDRFRCEIDFMDIGVPIARSTITKLPEKMQNLKKTDCGLNIFREKLEKFADVYYDKNPQQMLLMRYCREKEKYKVHLHEKSLCFFTKGEYTKVDSQKLFKEHFGILPMEDDNYLKSIGFPSLSERLGKSNFSCFVVDLDNNLYITPYRQDTMQHTYTTIGQNVLCAGMIFTVDGKIYYVDNRSGHYLTNPNHIIIFFEFITKNKGKNDLNDYFCEEFSLSRKVFSMNPTDVIEKKQFGINFYKFGDKSQEELLQERRIRENAGKSAVEGH